MMKYFEIPFSLFPFSATLDLKWYFFYSRVSSIYNAVNLYASILPEK